MNNYLIKEIYKEIIGIPVTIENLDESKAIVETTTEKKVEDISNGGSNVIDSSFLNHNYVRALFINVLTSWQSMFTNQENINEVFGIDLLNYNEDIYALFRSILYPLFGNNEAIESLIAWYICDREYINDEGKVITLPIYNEKNEEVDVSTPLKFYDYLLYLLTHSSINLINYDKQVDEDSFDEDEDED